MTNSNLYRLYLVTDEQQDTETMLHVIEEAVKGGVTCVQIREKHGDIRAFIRRAEAVKQLLKNSGVPLIINDRVDVALAVDADGVHLGQSDMPATVARQLLGADKLIGLSVENDQQLSEARSLPIDYIGLSAIFPTESKTDLKKYWGLEGLKSASQNCIMPIVAIGGINKANIASVWQSGASGIALVSAICHHPLPQRASQELSELIG
ncbi:thiamine phosphate synthase [Vibrio sp. SCSIO 43137]|uniref:thiamine phosphate synthase n=1 Tax=Vibrio sp. SCSIO 43137 TaxID=3021011 RepID=UPI0023077098|nr:thiamine phosphate synthase [Vibrio sp. SCSIO 43137]WCE29059.1 thiamine phosphate synthase [Vibrio sp. SCSIO 43137]